MNAILPSSWRMGGKNTLQVKITRRVCKSCKDKWLLAGNKKLFTTHSSFLDRSISFKVLRKGTGRGGSRVGQGDDLEEGGEEVQKESLSHPGTLAAGWPAGCTQNDKFGISEPGVTQLWGKNRHSTPPQQQRQTWMMLLAKAWGSCRTGGRNWVIQIINTGTSCSFSTFNQQTHYLCHSQGATLLWLPITQLKPILSPFGGWLPPGFYGVLNSLHKAKCKVINSPHRLQLFTWDPSPYISIWNNWLNYFVHCIYWIETMLPAFAPSRSLWSLA